MTKKSLFSIIFILVLFNLALFLYAGSIYFGNHADIVVHITDEGFIPDSIQIPVGGTIRWINKGTSSYWPASDFHPTHRQYPSKEVGCLGSALDACRGINNDEQYSFAFNQKGRWGIHDHLYPGMTMTVEVVDNILTARIFSYIKNIFSFNEFTRLPSVEEFSALDFNKQLEIVKKISSEDPQKAWIYVKGAYIKDGQVLGRNEADSSFIDYPHIFGHIVGNEAYKSYGIEGFSLCDGTFAYGCDHGVGEQALRELGIDAVQKCVKAGLILKCAHGLGHGLVAWSQYDTQKALKGCDDLSILAESLAEECYDGVFMEYMWSGPKDKIAENSRLEFCENSGHSRLCARYQTFFFIVDFDWSFERAAEECMNALNEEMRTVCGDALGFTAAHLAHGDSSKIEQYCSSIKGVDQQVCILTAAKELIHQQYYNWENTVNTLMASQESLTIAFYYNASELNRAAEIRWGIENDALVPYKALELKESKSLYKTDTIYLVDKDKTDAALAFAMLYGFAFSEYLEDDESLTEADVILGVASVRE